jgi:hypothetical protein
MLYTLNDLYAYSHLKFEHMYMNRLSMHSQIY